MLVFISYHTPDREKAQAIEMAVAARRPGDKCYLAPRSILGGAYWVPDLADAIGRADAVLFLAGRRIGPWQELEYYEALRLSREGAGRPKLIPVVIADQAPGLPYVLWNRRTLQLGEGRACRRGISPCRAGIASR